MSYLRKLFLIFLFVTSVVSCDNPFFPQRESYVTKFENTNGTQSPTYDEVIAFYKDLAKQYGTIALKTMGKTDSGLPLHIVIFNSDGDFNFAKIREEKAIILINNAIHPGETDGVDATMLLLRNLAQEQIQISENVVVVAIPIYNIGGALQRNATTRVNQNGPEEYGFRGNAKNYDLNRDFIKNDSENAKSFAEIFQLVQPDVFIDNHVTNGADYQYVLTYDIGQSDKLGSFVGEYMRDTLIPRLADSLLQRQQKIASDTIPEPFLHLVPYVNVWNKPPDAEGYAQMLDTPRYSTGYAGLWNTMGILIETHMLKPYKQRVEANYEMMKSLLDIVNMDFRQIKSHRAKQFTDDLGKARYAIKWEIDSTKVTELPFYGYEADTLISEVTGLPRLCYDRDLPFVKNIPYYNHYKPTAYVNIPKAYIIPKAWKSVVERLKNNKVELQEVNKDTVYVVDYYRIENYKTLPQPFEGHYLHFDTEVSKHKDSIVITKGDWIVETHQPARKYVLETLEPQAPDSFFNWNFFDSVLQRKEGFSPYVFEDIALQFLTENPEIKEEFEQKKAKEPDFAKSWYDQLDWIYQRTPHYEKAHLRYPVYRVE